MRRRAVYDRWFNRPTVTLAWAALAVALVHPAHGLGLEICWVSASTGLPCPGCGMTRALSSAARGMIDASWGYHPFGLPVLALFVLIAGVSLLPRIARRRFAAWVMRHHHAAHLAYVVFVVTFVGYGVARSIRHLLEAGGTGAGGVH